MLSSKKIPYSNTLKIFVVGDEMNPEISIVVPLYNAEKYIETCIVSILNQTFENFEVIVVDDCSTDNTLEIVQKFDDPRIKIVHQFKNSGESASRNLGLANARGKYVYFMDDDDAILEDNLENFYRAAEESNADIVHMNAWIDTDEKFPSGADAIINKEYCNNPEPRFLSDDLVTRLQNEFIDLGMYVTPWLKLSRRDFLIESGLHFPAMTRCGDVFHLFAELCFARKIQVIDACGYVYRLHSNQTVRQPLEKQVRAAMESMPAAIEFIQKAFQSKKLISPISRRFQNKFEQLIVIHFFNAYICGVYRVKLPQEQIDETFREVLSQPKMMSPELMRALINLIAFDYAQQ